MDKILVIEDDSQICEVIKLFFERNGTTVDIISDGDDAIAAAKEVGINYELVLLDIMLPHIDGFTICREIRKCCDIPIVFITARGREEDILYGYDLGCDDYIIKPFSLAALYAKCEAIVRRATGTSDKRLTCGMITLDTRKLCCYVSGEEVELAPKQFAILKYLMEHEGWVVTRDALLNRIWGYDFYGNDRVVDSHIKKLRKALLGAGKQIKTAIGRGYKLTSME